MRVVLKNQAGITKTSKVGFSWTFFFFGLFVPLVRGDMKNFFRIWLMCWFTLGIYQLFACFSYNKKYVQGLMEMGYLPVGEVDTQLLTSSNYYAG